MSDAIQVISRGNRRRLGRPRIRRLCVLFILGTLHHSIKQILEWSLVGRWLRADVVCGAAWELLRLEAQAVTIELAVGRQTKLECVLSGAKGYLSFGHRGEVL